MMSSGQSLVDVWLGSSDIGLDMSIQRCGWRVKARTSTSSVRRMLLDQKIEIGLAGTGRKVALPQRHVERDVLAAEKRGCLHAVVLLDDQRQQHQRLIERNHRR